MAAVKVDLPLVTSVKSGSTTVNRVMCGENKIWPTFPIVLKLNGVYYDVTGIQNNEYQKTEVPGEVCTLVKTTSSWYTDIQLRDNMVFDCWFTSYNSRGGACITHFSRTNENPGNGRQIRFINVTGTSDTFYLDYMSTSSSGTSDNRISKAVKSGTNGSNVDIRLDQQDLTYHLQGGAKFFNNESKPRIFFEITNDNGYYLYQRSNQCYGANNVRPKSIQVGLNGYGTSVFFTFYKVLIHNENNELVGNIRWKKVNDEWILYNFDTPCEKISGRIGTEYAYENKTMSFAPIVEDYYEVSGTITEGTKTYERLVNNKTGFVIKGIEV